jgi:hypothetical protein
MLLFASAKNVFCIEMFKYFHRKNVRVFSSTEVVKRGGGGGEQIIEMMIFSGTKCVLVFKETGQLSQNLLMLCTSLQCNV